LEEGVFGEKEGVKISLKGLAGPERINLGIEKGSAKKGEYQKYFPSPPGELLRQVGTTPGEEYLKENYRRGRFWETSEKGNVKDSAKGVKDD